MYEEIVTRVVKGLEKEFGSASIIDQLQHYDCYDNLVDEQAVVGVESEEYGDFSVLVTNPERRRSNK